MSPPLDIDRATLAVAVSNALGVPAIELSDWRVDPIHPAFNQATAGLYRVTGTASDQGEPVAWSIVLKIVQAIDDAFGGRPDPRHANYWKRELLIYRSGVLRTLPGIRAPRCFGVEERNGSSAWLWLEDIRSPSSSRWPLARYERAARRLGEFNGAYLVGRPLPSEACITRHWLGAFVTDFTEAFEMLSTVRDHAMVQQCWPGPLLDRVLRLWQERDLFLRALEELPQTFCHFDACPRNLLFDDETCELVAVDWAYAGIGAVGAELAPMVAASVCFFDAEPKDMRDIDTAVFDAYLEGLRSVGWGGSASLVRLGYTAAASLHYALFPMGVYLLSKNLTARFERVFGHPVSNIIERWVELLRFLLDQADEARRLARAHQASTLTP